MTGPFCDNFIMTEDGENFEMTQTTKGDPGEGVPTGGTAGQVLKKVSDDDYDTEWADNNAGDVGYDSTETYQSGTAGAALNDLTRQLSDLTDTVSTTQIINTASGAIASFDDGADEQPIRKLVAQIEPVQDLHGYDHPWPAGGGVNKYNGADIIFIADASATTLNGITLTKNSDGSFTVVGTATAETRLNTRAAYDFKAGKSYTISVRGLTDGNIRIVINGSVSGSGLDYTSAFPTSDFSGTYTITADFGFAYFFIDVQNGATVNNTIRVQIEEGQLTDWTPYSNICPISGRTGLEIEQTGKNIWDEEWELGVFNNSTGEKIPNSSNIRSTNYIGIKPGKSYAFIKPDASRVFYYGIDRSFISTVVVPTNTSVITAPDNAYYLRFQISGTTYNNDISINYPATDTEYHPYTGNQISVNLEDEAGTVYGGTLDVTNGVLTDDAKPKTNFSRGEKDSSGKLYNIGTVTDGYYSTSQLDYLSRVLCSALPVLGIQDARNSTVPCLTYLASSSVGNFYVGGFIDKESELDALLADTDFSVVYPLATPITYQLNPQEIRTLLGTNNVWADTGDIEECEYPADTKLYIDGKIADAIAALQS